LEVGKMQTTHFIKYLSLPGTIKLMPEQDASSLVKEFPYCQSGQLLLALQMNFSNHLLFEQQLKKSAVYSSDRKRLFELINSPTAQQEKEVVVAPIEAVKLEEKTPVIEEVSITEQPTLVEVKPAEETIKDLELEYLNELISSSYTYELEGLEKLEVGRQKSEDRSQKTEEALPIEEEEEQLDENTELTFTDWLKKVQKGGLTSVTEEKPEKQHKFDLIDKFIQEDPKIKPKKTEFYSPINMARLSVVDDSELVSETLALIQVEQGNYQEAIKTYQKLSLKNPEKRTYFANQIKILNQKIK
jgi:tetratricopeptide (TPR) repeat protein